MFVEASSVEEGLSFDKSKLYKVLDVYQHTIQLCVFLPDPSKKPSGWFTRSFSHRTKFSTLFFVVLKGALGVSKPTFLNKQ